MSGLGEKWSKLEKPYQYAVIANLFGFFYAILAWLLNGFLFGQDPSTYLYSLELILFLGLPVFLSIFLMFANMDLVWEITIVLDIVLIVVLPLVFWTALRQPIINPPSEVNYFTLSLIAIWLFITIFTLYLNVKARKRWHESPEDRRVDPYLKPIFEISFGVWAISYTLWLITQHPWLWIFHYVWIILAFALVMGFSINLGLKEWKKET